MKGLRDAGLEQWSKAMTDFVHSEAYARANGEFLEAWVGAAAPVREAMQAAIVRALAEWNLPSRDDVTRLAERLTRIEMRLDDLDAKLDAGSAPRTPAHKPGAKR
jgi:hypothetical protein